MFRMLGFVACLVLAGAAGAQETRGGYVGAAYGLISYDEMVELPEVRIPVSDSAGAYRLLGGWQLNSNYAIEVGWTKTSGLSEDFGFLVNVDVEFEAATLRGLALAPFGNIAMFGGLGYYDATAKIDVVIDFGDEVLRFSGKNSDSGLTAVGGIQFDLSRLSIRGEYEWFDTDGNTDASSLNVGVLFRF